MCIRDSDYAGTQACRSLKEEGVEVCLVNSNPATIMTDKQIADQVYICLLYTSIGKNKAAGDVGCPSINSSGLYFGNSPVSVGYRLVSNKGSILFPI